MEESQKAGHVIRKFEVTRNNEKREVFHYHFVAWPDHGVPRETHTLTALLDDLKSEERKQIPVIIHCSAGIGRTGTLIALSHLKQIIGTQKQQRVDFGVSVFSVVRRLREQRTFMVQSREQFELLYQFVLEWVR